MELRSKYRPKELSELYGNNELKKTISKLIETPANVPQVILFTGSSGTGKTTLARILANCLNAEIIEKNNADDRGIEAMRELCDSIHMMPLGHSRRVYLLDEFHMVTKASQNVLLKNTDDPPSYAYFFICTTDPQDIISTLRNRCTILNLKPLNQNEGLELVNDIAKKEGYDLDQDIAKRIVRSSNGSGRSALVLLNKVIATNGQCNIEKIEDIETQVIELAQAILKRVPWDNLAPMLNSIEDEPETVRRILLAYFYRVLIANRSKSHVTQSALAIECLKDSIIESGKAGLAMACYYAVYNDK